MRKLLSILLLLVAMNAAAQVDYERHVFKGKLGGKIAVEIAFQQAMNDGEWVTAGYIYYPNAKTPAPILIVGKDVKVDPKLPNRITGTVLAIIFHLLQFLYYSERDTRQSCKLANTSAEIFDGF